ncbi:MAG: D-glycerate dehydrogenase [Bacteroidales bacterium]|nr:D-glycerate dehydrogenase [Bacteroidales bacterium]
MMKRVLLTRIFPERAAEMLSNAGFAVTQWQEDRPMLKEELIQMTQDHDAILCTLTDTIDKAFMDACPRLEVISQFAVGYDNIDVATATLKGIPVGYTPDVLTEATADVAFGLMINASRNMFFMHKQIIAGQWGYFRPKAHLGMELKNKTLGILGMGRIGTAMARRCRGAYNMSVIYHNRNRNESAEKELNARYVDFDTLLAESDVLSVHCALTRDTRGIFNKASFGKMKHTALFINTARGGVHNETDLIEALERGVIWGAGLDVTNPEPMLPENPLLQMEHVAVLPHIGSATSEARNAMANLAAENIIRFFRNREMHSCVNPECL